MADDLRLLSPHEVAVILGIKPQTLMKLCQRGELSYVDVGRGRKKVRRMFEREDVEKFIARRRRTEQWQKGDRRERSRRAAGSGELVNFVELEKQRRKPK